MVFDLIRPLDTVSKLIYLSIDPLPLTFNVLIKDDSVPFPLEEDEQVRGEAKVSGVEISPSLLHDHASYDGGYGGKDLISPSVSHSCIRIHSLDIFSHHPSSYEFFQQKDKGNNGGLEADNITRECISHHVSFDMHQR